MKINDYLLWLSVGLLACYVLYMVFKFSLLSGFFFFLCYSLVNPSTRKKMKKILSESCAS